MNKGDKLCFLKKIVELQEMAEEMRKEINLRNFTRKDFFNELSYRDINLN